MVMALLGQWPLVQTGKLYHSGCLCDWRHTVYLDWKSYNYSNLSSFCRSHMDKLCEIRCTTCMVITNPIWIWAIYSLPYGVVAMHISLTVCMPEYYFQWEIDDLLDVFLQESQGYLMSGLSGVHPLSLRKRELWLFVLFLANWRKSPSLLMWASQLPLAQHKVQLTGVTLSCVLSCQTESYHENLTNQIGVSLHCIFRRGCKAVILECWLTC